MVLYCSALACAILVSALRLCRSNPIFHPKFESLASQGFFICIAAGTCSRKARHNKKQWRRHFQTSKVPLRRAEGKGVKRNERKRAEQPIPSSTQDYEAERCLSTSFCVLWLWSKFNCRGRYKKGCPTSFEVTPKVWTKNFWGQYIFFRNYIVQCC